MKVGFRWSSKNRYSIAVLSAVVDFEIVENPVEFKGDVLLYSFATAQSKQVYSEVKNLNGKYILIAGGPHPTARPVEVLNAGFDYAVLGEGEETLPELLRAIQTGSIHEVRGIAFKDRGEVIITQPRGQVDLDSYPPFSEKVLGPIEISRGCPHACKFCQTPRLFGKIMRHRSVEKIARYASYYRDIRFITPNAFAYGSNGLKLELEKIEALLKLLKNMDKRIYFGTFPSEVRPEFVTSEALELVKQYCANDSLHIGGQSGSERILKEINRGHSVEDIINAVELCLEFEIVPVVDLLFGLPSETIEDQIATLDLAKWICAKRGRIRVHYFKPLPSTPFEDQKPVPLAREVRREIGRLALAGKIRGGFISSLDQVEG
ncbi:MAG: TIGR04013 family B12-binding domain/radical SAM domain-containing protein [Methanocellales archaeon]